MNSTASAKPPLPGFRRLLRWFLRVLALALVLLIGPGSYLAVRHWWAMNQLTVALAQEDAKAPGWRLEDIEAARPNIPDEENGMLVVRETVRLLPKEWPPRDAELPKLDGSSRPDQRLPPNMRTQLRELLETCKPARATACKLAGLPTGRAQLSFARNPYETLLPHAQEARTVAFLLTFDALQHIEDGELDEAALLCRAAINAGRSIGDEPIPISQLVRIACVTMAGHTIERLLAQGEPRAADLVLLQSVLEEEAQQPGLVLAYRGERAMVHGTFVVTQNGEFVLDLGQERFRPPTRTERWYTLPHRDTLRLQEAEAFPVLNKLVEIAETPAHRRAQLIQDFRAMVQAAGERGNMAALLVHGVEKLEAAFTRRDCYLKCLTTALAAERYRHLHGNWPPTLAALAPNFLDASPLDVFDAQPLRYERLNGGVVIYSLCPDAYGKVFDPEKPSPHGEGIAVRLWNVEQRGKAE